MQARVPEHRRESRQNTKKAVISTRDQAARLVGTKAPESRGLLPAELDKLPRSVQLKKLKELGITQSYEPLLAVEAGEHFRMILQILRNLSFIVPNEPYLARNKALTALVVQVFATATEVDLHANSFSFITNLAR